jgi:hypothetical protein
MRDRLILCSTLKSSFVLDAVPVILRSTLGYPETLQDCQ